MAENTTPAKCSEAVYQAARAAGLLIVTTGEEAAVQKFADAMYAMGYADATEFIATGESQDSRNREGFVINLQHGGETKTIAEWARQYGLGDTTLRYRLQNGWSVERALTTKSDLQIQMQGYIGGLE